MMNKQKVVKTTIKHTFPLEKRPGHFQIKAAFIATKKKTKKKEYLSNMCFANMQRSLTYHRFIIMVVLQPDRFPKALVPGYRYVPGTYQE